MPAGIACRRKGKTMKSFVYEEPKSFEKWWLLSFRKKAHDGSQEDKRETRQLRQLSKPRKRFSLALISLSSGYIF